MSTNQTPSRLRRIRSPRMVVCASIMLGVAAPLLAGDGGDSRVVVVRPQPGGTQIPLGPNERVVTVAGVNLPGRGPVAVVGIKTMPPKPDFNIITPDGASHPFKRVEDVGNGVTVEYEVQVLNSPGGDKYRVVGHIKRGANKIGESSETYPLGSVYVPDPPQPPGTMLMIPIATALPPDQEAIVLAAAGIPDLVGPQAYNVVDGTLLVSHPGAPISVIEVTGGAAKGDLNCDELITVGDISPFVLTLIDPAGYDAAFPMCDFMAADCNRDGVVSVSDIGPFVGLLTAP